MAESDGKQGKTVDPDLVTAVAHDLKTPIGAVRGFLELMEHVGTFNDQQRHLSERILGALDHMQELIVDFEDVAHLDSGVALKREDTDFVILCDEAINIVRGLADAKQINVAFSASHTVITVSCDANLIRRVIINLLENGIKYSEPDSEVSLTLSLKTDHIQVNVRDIGTGIEEADQPFVFDRFYRTRRVRDKKISGSGLGLAIARMIVEQHGGRIWLESVIGQGSTFSFILPLEVKTGTGSSDDDE